MQEIVIFLRELRDCYDSSDSVTTSWQYISWRSLVEEPSYRPTGDDSPSVIGHILEPLTKILNRGKVSIDYGQWIPTEKVQLVVGDCLNPTFGEDSQILWRV